MEASATALKTSAAIRTTPAAVKTAASTARTATATGVTAAFVLSEGWNWQECKTDDSRKCDERSAKTECAHNLYLSSNLGALFRAMTIFEEDDLYLMRFYCYARRCADAKSN
jgi:putative flippase GtrA